MGFKFKLNDDMPSQHLAILVLAGTFILLNLVDAYRGPQDADSKRAAEKYTERLDELTGEVVAQKTTYLNPKLTWYESIFCRGNQRSANCSFRFLHPITEDSEEGDLPDEEPRKNHVISYRGSIEKNAAFSSRLQAPGDDTDPHKAIVGKFPGSHE